ncbi:hypothetical protein SEA_OSMAXIMUS_84 [Pegunavirus osmaximus]|uniref:Uncharacterized protein n=1 Tax=Mycobacterium phage OSmaximus TaxID=1035482 RepID=G1DJ56_9CAUD|nr:hypothetical protein AVU74_gp084 [Mycobacterium phage OSmaximus]AEJ92853.1 hypothetical protein SEA_OSMAXIMUS_84 [Mycobacterium phage OSmaximus]
MCSPTIEGKLSTMKFNNHTAQGTPNGRGDR